MSSILIILFDILGSALVFACGYKLGYTIRDIKDDLVALKTRQDAIDQDQADTTPDVVVAKTPQQVREHKLDDDNESAIVDALSPREIAERKKQRTLKEIEARDV